MYTRRIHNFYCKEGHRRTPDSVNVQGSCKLCAKVWMLLWRALHPNESALYSRRYRANNPQKAENTNLRVRYGIGLEERDALLEQQNNCCAICETQFSKDCRPRVDHVHGTERVRGLLCNACNLLLGWANDSTEVLSKAIQYLERAK